MQRARLVNDLYELSTEAVVEFDIDNGWVVVKQIQTPEGWHPNEIDLRLEVDEYPAHPPVVYVPEESRYQGSRSPLMMPPPMHGDPDWCQLDLTPWATHVEEDTNVVAQTTMKALAILRLHSDAEDSKVRLDDTTAQLESLTDEANPTRESAGEPDATDGSSGPDDEDDDLEGSVSE